MRHGKVLKTLTFHVSIYLPTPDMYIYDVEQFINRDIACFLVSRIFNPTKGLII